MATERLSTEPAEPAVVAERSQGSEGEAEPRAHVVLTKVGAMRLLGSMVASPRKHAGLRKLVEISNKYRKTSR